MRVVRALIKKGYDVEVIMTNNATKFISPLTLGALINKPVLVDDFDDEGYKSNISVMLKKLIVLLLFLQQLILLAKLLMEFVMMC